MVKSAQGVAEAGTPHVVYQFNVTLLHLLVLHTLKRRKKTLQEVYIYSDTQHA